MSVINAGKNIIFNTSSTKQYKLHAEEMQKMTPMFETFLLSVFFCQGSKCNGTSSRSLQILRSQIYLLLTYANTNINYLKS